MAESKYAQPTLITSDVKQAIKQLAKLAPLHNPANLIGIEACQSAFSHLPQVAVFDTAFHQTMPEKSFIYGLTLRALQTARHQAVWFSRHQPLLCRKTSGCHAK